MNPVQIIAIILLIFAAALPVMCLVKIWLHQRFKKQGEIVMAEVVAVEKRQGFRSTWFLVNFRYRTVEGVEYTGHTPFTGKKKVGDSFNIIYKKTDPVIFKVDFISWVYWLLAFTILFAGLIGWLCFYLLNLEYT